MDTVGSHRLALPDLGPRGEGWIGIQTSLIVAVLVGSYLSGPDWTGGARMATYWLGAALIVAGIAMFVRGALDLGRGFSIWMAPVADHVVETGIYAHLRHPICGGQVLIAFGWALLRASWLGLGLAVVYGVLVALKNYHEETMVERRFPAYGIYRARVRRRWFPGVM